MRRGNNIELGQHKTMSKVDAVTFSKISENVCNNIDIANDLMQKLHTNKLSGAINNCDKRLEELKTVMKEKNSLPSLEKLGTLSYINHTKPPILDKKDRTLKNMVVGKLKNIAMNAMINAVTTVESVQSLEKNIPNDGDMSSIALTVGLILMQHAKIDDKIVESKENCEISLKILKEGCSKLQDFINKKEKFIDETKQLHEIILNKINKENITSPNAPLARARDALSEFTSSDTKDFTKLAKISTELFEKQKENPKSNDSEFKSSKKIIKLHDLVEGYEKQLKKYGIVERPVIETALQKNLQEQIDTLSTGINNFEKQVDDFIISNPPLNPHTESTSTTNQIDMEALLKTLETGVNTPENYGPNAPTQNTESIVTSENLSSKKAEFALDQKQDNTHNNAPPTQDIPDPLPQFRA